MLGARREAAAAPAARKLGPAHVRRAQLRRRRGREDEGDRGGEARRSPRRRPRAAARSCFSGGTYLTGPIHLKSNITLYVDAGTVLKFSSDFDDYLPMVRSRWEGTEVANFSPLIYGDKVENVAITGRGLIDGGGEPWWKHLPRAQGRSSASRCAGGRSKWQQEFARLNTDARTSGRTITAGWRTASCGRR